MVYIGRVLERSAMVKGGGVGDQLVYLGSMLYRRRGNAMNDCNDNDDDDDGWCFVSKFEYFFAHQLCLVPFFPTGPPRFRS